MKLLTVSKSPVFYLAVGIVLTFADSVQGDMIQAGNAEPYGNFSIAIGETNEADNNRPPTTTLSTAPFSIALGYSDRVEAEGATAIGYFNLATAPYSTALGVGTSAKTFGQFVVGTYNAEQQNSSSSGWGSLSLTDHLFIIGNGTGVGDRKNALVVKRNGDMIVTGNMLVTGNVTANGGPLLSTTAASSAYVPLNGSAVRVGAGTSVGGGGLAVGNNVNADNVDSIGIGKSVIPDPGSVALGRDIVNSYTLGANNVTVGIGIDTYGCSNVIMIGQALTSYWGGYSTIMGHGGSAGGVGVTMLGYQNLTWGDYNTTVGSQNAVITSGAVAVGRGLSVNTYGEVALGSYNTEAYGTYDAWVAADRLLSVGNGTPQQRRDAFTIWKSGRARLEGQFTATQGFRTPERGGLSMGSYTSGTPVLP